MLNDLNLTHLNQISAGNMLGKQCYEAIGRIEPPCIYTIIGRDRCEYLPCLPFSPIFVR